MLAHLAQSGTLAHLIENPCPSPFQCLLGHDIKQMSDVDGKTKYGGFE